MSQLDQIQITYAAAEDRLLMRLSTQGGEEFRFWLTRRFVKALRPKLSQGLSSRPRIQVQPDPIAKRELLNFEREQAVQTSDFRTPFKGQENALPLGPEPIVLTRFQVRPGDKGEIVLAVGPESGNGIDLALSPHVVHSLTALLDKALGAAAWDLDQAAKAGKDIEAPAGPATVN